jgi:flagellar biosynthesis/type III secretory pathway protein FliH
MKNKIVTVLALTMSLGLVSCKKSYLEGFSAGEVQGYNNGYNDGYGDGYDAGYDVGWENAKVYFSSADYASGFSDGQAQGLVTGYNNGHAAGLSQGLNTGYNNGYGDGYLDGDENGFARGQTSGYNLGYNDGFDDGVDYGMDPAALTAAYNNGYDDGFDDGYDLGIFDGYNLGYDNGFDDGYDFGFDDGYDYGFSDGYYVGYDDGYYDGSWGFSSALSLASTTDLDGLPHNNMSNANPKVSVAATLASDLVDMKKVQKLEDAYIKGFKQSLGVLEETQMTPKDLNKLAAAKESFRVKQLTNEIAGEYGLNPERADKIAKLAIAWRKNANSRAITAEDADAFSEGLIGVNIKEIEAAYKKTLKGEMGDLTVVLKKAAEVNEISEFHASRLMLKLFL